MIAGLPLVHELVAAPDPLEACRRFADLPFVLLLDSARQDRQLGRYSFLCADPGRVFRSKGALKQQWTNGADGWLASSSDPLGSARELLRRFALPAIPELPPFQGGVAGYLGYEWGTALERVPRPRHDDAAIPDALLGLYDWVIAWDHVSERAWIVSTGIPEDPAPRRMARAGERLTMVRERLAARPRRAAPLPVSMPARFCAASYPVPDVPQIRSNFSRDGYLDAVGRVIEYVFAGDIFQANLSQRFQAPLLGTRFALYERLRRHNPAPFAAFFDAGAFAIVSSSPERFLRVHDGQVEARPIKGTRPRGVGPEHDAALALALVESDKDKAENVMIVDLLRNDLSRVCRPGSVRVPELFALEHYATVHHLVSTVTGDLGPQCDALDLLQAAFPGGSITGAPKVRAMQIIAELEPTARGVYCGAIGYMSLSGAMDTSIVIRTYLVRGEETYFHAGGGIVAESNPEAEYAETLDKARALIAALAP